MIPEWSAQVEHHLEVLRARPSAWTRAIAEHEACIDELRALLQDGED